MKTITNSNQWMRNAKTALPAPIPALALILSLATACTNQELPGATDATTTTADTRTMTITATMADDRDSNTGGNNDGQPQTRVSHETDPNGGVTPGVIVKWTKGDAFKLYPATGNAAEFEIKDGDDIKDDGKTATFTGSLGTDANGTGNALYPATAALKKTGEAATKWGDIALKMDGQKQTGDNNYAHLSSYDYMTASVTDVTSLPAGNDLAFHHLAAMMTLKITGAPTDYTATTGGNGTTDNSPELLTLTAGQAPGGSGEYGIFYKSIGANGKLITSNYPSTTSSINLALEGITWGAEGFTAHLMMLPTDLKDKTFTVSVRCKDGTTYRYTTPQIGKKYVAGMRYTATIPGGNNWTKATGETNALVFNNDTQAATSFASGKGTATDPYIIATAGELKYLVEQVNKEEGYNTFSNKYFRLATDIIVENGTNWTPIGLNIGNKLRYFAGHFDGNDHTIYGTLTNSDNGTESGKDSNFGFFGNISNGSVCNLHIKAKITNAYAGSSSVYTGGLAGTINYTEISGCSSDGEIQGGTTTGSGDSHTGGLIGFANSGSTISNCTVSGTVTAGAMTTSKGKNNTGGVAGYISSNGTAHSATMQSCTNHAVITGSPGGGSKDSNTGGIAGHTSYTSISHCTNHGQVTVQYTASGGNCYVGGLIGIMETNTKLSDSENQGAVTGGQVYTEGYVSCCGGLTGQTIASATATNCTNSGTVSGNTESSKIKKYTGGLVGRNYGTLHQCLNTAEAAVTGETSAGGSCTGGLVGYYNGGAVYNCCTNLANVNSATPEDGNRIGGYDNYERSKVKDCDQGHTHRGGNE